jgi:hypothetical protein
MFSLLITIISIALVAALAIATIFYGGEIVKKSRAKATAATFVTQGQQMLGATEMFKAIHGRWPATADELVESKLLKGIPVAPGNAAVVSQLLDYPVFSLAYAGPEGRAWEQVQSLAPQFWLLRSTSEQVCRAINQQVRGDDGIYNAARRDTLIQCFGTEENYTVLVHLRGDPDIGTTVPAAGGTPTLEVDDDGGGWAVPPTGSSHTPPPDPEPAIIPSVTSLIPADGPAAGGTTVTITGTEFQPTSQVIFNGTAVPTTYLSPTQLEITSPAGTAGSSVPVRVSNPGKNGGTSGTTTFTYEEAPDIPAVSSLAPTSGTPAGGTVVTITGTSFLPESEVLFNGNPVATTYVSATEIQFTTPVGTPNSSMSVSVRNPGESRGTSSNLTYVYTSGALAGTVTSIAGAQAFRFAVGPDSRTLYSVASGQLRKFSGGTWVPQTVSFTNTCPAATNPAPSVPRNKVEFLDVAYEGQSGKFYMTGWCKTEVYRAEYWPLQLYELDVATMSANVVYTAPMSATGISDPGRLSASRKGALWMALWDKDVTFRTSDNKMGAGVATVGTTINNYIHGVVFRDLNSNFNPLSVVLTNNPDEVCSRTQFGTVKCTTMSNTTNRLVGWDLAANDNLYVVLNGVLSERTLNLPATSTGAISFTTVKTIVSSGLPTTSGKVVVAPDGSVYVSNGSGAMYHIQ